MGEDKHVNEELSTKRGTRRVKGTKEGLTLVNGIHSTAGHTPALLGLGQAVVVADKGGMGTLAVEEDEQTNQRNRAEDVHVDFCFKQKKSVELWVFCWGDFGSSKDYEAAREEMRLAVLI